MALSEIEKLERRYAENPQGLTFAPLAEVHRKNGDTARALELLRPGLELHPDYIPASIVLGRCHLDLGDLPSAEAAFTHVLALDNENVIALKSLADIDERLHHFDRAQNWLHQLLALDRSNDDARAQLERIETARTQASEVAARASVAEEPLEVQAESSASEAEGAEAVEGVEAVEEIEPVEMEPVEEVGLEMDSLEPAPMSLEEPPSLPPPPLALEELEFSRMAADSDEPPPAGFEIEDLHRTSETTAETVEPLAGLVGRDVDHGVEDEWAVETSEDIVLRSSGGSEFQVPDASQELFASRQAPEPGPLGESKPIQETRPEPVEEPPPRFVELSALAEPAAKTEPEAPQEPAAKPEPAPVAQAEPESVAPPRARFAAADTNGESVASFLGKLLAARLPGGGTASAPSTPPPAPAEADAGGAPTRPAADALSLSSVFGEEPATLPTVGPTPGTPSGAVSFDEFYSPTGPATGSRNPRSPEKKNDDLDQFHAWLQNLKR
jgi:Tetratricopeptide repeat